MFRRIQLFFANQNIPLNSILKKDNNNFDLLRLLASVGVIFGHAFAVFKSEYKEPTKAFLTFTYSGDLGVYFFFFLSGMLITASFLNTKSTGHFILKRIARIWPALIVCVALTIFIVGPAFSNLNWDDYIASPATRQYFTSNLLLYNLTYSLPGVFINNFYKNIVNGSLWTLFIEVRCYLFVLIAGLIQLFSKRHFFFYVCIAIFICSIIKINYLEYFFRANGVYLFLFFIAGVSAYTLRKKIFINPYVSFILIIIWLICKPYDSVVCHLLFYIVFLYAVVALNINRFFLKIRLPGDYSYGMYIYGFLIQQCVAAYFPQMTAYTSLLVTLPIITIMAMISWHLIEQPSIIFAHSRIKNNLRLNKS
jgi:peptidoglycan/LPS O-acetylase OafA/YrhL